MGKLCPTTLGIALQAEVVGQRCHEQLQRGRLLQRGLAHASPLAAGAAIRWSESGGFFVVWRRGSKSSKVPGSKKAFEVKDKLFSNSATNKEQRM